MKMYPDLKVEWRTVISRYNYHFGGIDEQENALKKRSSAASSDFSREGSLDKSIVTSPDASNDAETANGNSPSSYGAIISRGMNDIEKDTTESTNMEELHESSLDDSNFRSNVKGFRNWTSRMQQELVETKQRLTQEHPNLIPGSSDFNHLLLREFQKLNPKCMESSRSIYSKLQSIEKTLNSPVNDNTVASKCWSAINQSTEGNTSNPDLAPMNNDCPTLNGESTTRLRDSPVHETQSDSTHCSSKNAITKNHEIPPDNTNNLDSNEDDKMILSKSNENSTIDGFEDWTLGMIRDFISCMDTARRRHAELRENQPNEQVKLVPLLLEEWRRMYPSSTESVKTFLVKIKHLKLQKDVIKKHLVGGGNTATSSNDSTDGLGFKWNRDMIQDVIDSRRRALDIKDNALAQGKKLSFHALWASEFKKVYPNSTFTSNNLSVHFWTWRKQQLKKKRLSKKATAPSDTSKGHSTLVLGNGNSSNSLEQSKDAKVYNAPGPWSKLYKKQLLEVGRRVEQMLQGKDTPNEVKLEGFANILHAEWKKVQKATNGTKQDVSARAINMMYSRLLREKDPSLYSNEASVEATIKHLTTNNNDDVLDDVDSRITATWTPKHNRVLRECMEGKLNDGIDQNPISNAVLTDRIIKQWRKKFPKSSISDDNLSRRITDSMVNLEAAHVSSSSGKIQKHVDTNDTKEYLTVKEEKPFLSSTGNLGLIDSDTKRLPNRKGQMIWNKESIVDLFKTHHETKEDMNNGTIVTKNDSRQMAFSLHKSFVKRYSHCRLSAVMLLAKYYKLKNEIASGNLDIKIPNFEDSKIKTEAIKSEVISNPTSKMEILLDCNTNNMSTGLNKETGMRDLVFRTWTQEMIDDMLKTRSIAIAKKKSRSQKDPCDPITITDLWYDEFLKCHPNYKSTKKNLWRKYKWYMSRIRTNSDKHFGVDNGSSPTSGKDTSLHENKLMGNNNKALKITKDEIDEESAARLKPVRKDVFHFIKAVLEESRIFLPMKLPEEPLMKKPGKDISIRAGGKTTPCDSGMAMAIETTGTEHHAADNYTTISALVKTNEVQPDFPSSLNVPNLSCLNTNDVRPSSRTSSNVTLQQMFAPSQPLITSVPKLPASVTVTPRHSDTMTTEEQGNKGGKNTSEGKRSSIKLPGKFSRRLLDNTILENCTTYHKINV